MKRYIIGIDLHGTMLDKNESMEEKHVRALIRALGKLKENALLYICTGNDLTFVNEKIPDTLRDVFDGYVLETGCVLSDKSNEKQITTPTVQEHCRELKELIESKGFEQIKHQGRRLSTISLFCDAPKEFADIISKFVNTTEFSSEFQVTYSSVAVDIIPNGFHKLTGLELKADNKKTIGIADSMNDFPLLRYADFGFMPANAAPEVIAKLEADGRPTYQMDMYEQPRQGSVGIVQGIETKGVIQILQILDDWMD